MSMLHADKNAANGGYLIGTGIFLAIFVAAVVAQIMTKNFNPWIYWIAIVASTTVGTTMADYSIGRWNWLHRRFLDSAGLCPGFADALVPCAGLN